MRPDLLSSDEGRIGQHINRFLPPDIIYMRVVGELSNEHGNEINRQHYEMGKDIDGVFFLCDISELESVTAETRKGAVEVQKKMAIAGIVILKAPMKARIFAKLILTATNLFRTEKMPVVFVETEEEGWAWIEQQREKYRGWKSSPAPLEA